MFVQKRGKFRFTFLLQLNIEKKNHSLHVDGRREVVNFNKIKLRIQKLCYGLNMDFVDPVNIFNIQMIEKNYYYILFKFN